jgi:hypothetical protein
MITRLICSLGVTTVVTVTPAWAQDQTALRNLSAVEIHQQVRSGSLRSADLVKALLAAAEESKNLNAFITLHRRP